MADLQRAQESPAFERFAPSPQTAASQRPAPADETTRPRIGRRPRRTKRRSRSRIDAGVALRALAVSCIVAVFVLGGFFLLHSLGLGRSAEEAEHMPPGTVEAVAGLVPTTAPATAAPAEDAGRIAALLSSEPAPSPAPAEASPTGGPTPADFTRPAFLEPRAADKADADAVDDPQPDPTPQADPARALPLPATRPAVARAAADGAEETGSVGQEGRITTAINLRSAPQRGSAVLATLEAGTKVTVYSCKSWCEVAAGGKRGYVYSRAVDQ